MVRRQGAGGGLAIGALHNLNPTWLGEGDDYVEWLSVEITLQLFRIRCVVAYGPQEADCNDRKEKFWAQLDSETTTAQNQGTGLIIQMDGNLWAGPALIPGDPHAQNKNGKLFENFLARNSHLSVVNSLEQCEGLITRFRKTINGEEKSVLDFFIVCDKVRSYLNKMVVDEENQHSLTNFHPANQGRKVKVSDHNPLIMELNLMSSGRKSERLELFNFKNEECQKTCHSLTNETSRFS